MIYAIGHDIVEIQRIEFLFNRYSTRLVNKVLSFAEQDILATHPTPVRFIAKRFAAKEALAKACGTGLRTPILMPNITIINDALGKPSFSLSSAITAWLNERQIKNCHLSISDETNLASAFVVLEQ